MFNRFAAVLIVGVLGLVGSAKALTPTEVALMSVGDVVETRALCKEIPMKQIAIAATESSAAANEALQGAIDSGTCIYGRYLVTIVAKSYQFTDFTNTTMQVWEVDIPGSALTFKVYSWAALGKQS